MRAIKEGGRPVAAFKSPVITDVEIEGGARSGSLETAATEGARPGAPWRAGDRSSRDLGPELTSASGRAKGVIGEKHAKKINRNLAIPRACPKSQERHGR